MPSEAMWLELGKRRTSICLGELLALKQVFGIISQATYCGLFDEFDRLGWRSLPYEEYGAIAGDRPTRSDRLCLRALAEGAITESKAAELLDIPIDQVDHHMCGTPLDSRSSK